VVEVHVSDQIENLGRHVCLYFWVFYAAVDVLAKGLLGIIDGSQKLLQTELVYAFIVLLSEGLKSGDESYEVSIGNSFGKYVQIFLREVSDVANDVDEKVEINIVAKP